MLKNDHNFILKIGEDEKATLNFYLRNFDRRYEIVGGSKIIGHDGVSYHIVIADHNKAVVPMLEKIGKKILEITAVKEVFYFGRQIA